MSISVYYFNGAIDLDATFDYTEDDKNEARSTIAKRINQGRLMAARFYPCIHCGNQAHEYHHHNGYDGYHREDVVPVCKSCHKKAEKALTDRYEKANGIDVAREKKKIEDAERKITELVAFIDGLPKTEEDARSYYVKLNEKYRIAQDYDKDKCAYPTYGLFQCRKGRARGDGSLYCNQHNKIIINSKL